MKISIKLGLWFSLCILLIEMISMTILHRDLVHSQVHREFDALLAKGNNYRGVLEVNADSHTLSHIRLMGEQSDAKVVVTDTNGKILVTSHTITNSIQDILALPFSSLSKNGKMIQTDWKKEQYIATVTAIQKNGSTFGYVYMFKDTNDIKKLVTELNKHIFIASILIVFTVLIFIFLLSKVLTKPLISMQEATKKLSNGDFSVTLPPPSKDELGELSDSIQTLAKDLNYLKGERNEFLASISHELRTPLTYINGYAVIAKRKGLTEQDRLHYLEIIQEESQRVSRLVQELFDLAKLDHNTFSINKEEVYVGAFVQSIYDRVLPAFKHKGIQLDVDCPKQLFLELDPIRIEQVLLNLLDNSLKYSKESSMTVIRISKSSGKVQLTVTDQGIGIPAEDLPHIFDRLYRVDKSRSRSTGGFGLGLAIAKQLVEAHGGEIRVKSQVGAGTCFTIFLPA